MKVALIYDRLNKIGGAEQVLTSFHELYPLADWYTSVWDIKKAAFSRDWNVYSSFLNRVPFFRTHHELIPYLMPFAFESFDLTKYDLVISIGSAECKGVITRPETLHLHYCLTPTRYLYSHKQEYLTNPLLRLIAKYLLLWDQLASTRPDQVISISKHVKNRVQKYYNRDSDVIYPPVDTAKFHKSKILSPKSSGYYLVVSRLVSYKNIMMVVKAFNQNGKQLVVVGEGSEKSKLQSLAKGNIHFAGLVPESDLVSYYAGCTGFIQANIEDFGIAMVEALASGKPVIAYREGGAGEIVTDKIGVLYNELSARSLNEAIVTLEKKKITSLACQKRAAIFDKVLWKKVIKERIMSEWEKHQKIYG